MIKRLFQTLVFLMMPALAPAEVGASDLDAIRNVDVFVTAGQASVISSSSHDLNPSITIRIHALDGIERLEAQLSSGLAGDPPAAKQQVLQRFKTLNRENHQDLQAAAEGLALAQRIGVERYPAIVFDERWVVYGELNLSRAVMALQELRRSELH